MLNIHSEPQTTTPAPFPNVAVEETSTTPVATIKPWYLRLWDIVKSYPVPFGTVSLMIVSLVGKIAQVDRVVSRCLPEEKVRIVKKLEQQGHRVLMVGDGINDAPALATATVGMALGTQGLNAAASAADTVLLSTDILRVARAVRLGRRVMRVAMQGI